MFKQQLTDRIALPPPKHDFLRLKSQLSIKSMGETTTFCFRSNELLEVTNLCKDLKYKVLEILEVEVDPKNGLRIQEAAIKLKKEKERFGSIREKKAGRARLEIIKSWAFLFFK